MFRTMLSDNTELSDEKIAELADAFMNTLPVMLKTQLQADVYKRQTNERSKAMIIKCLMRQHVGIIAQNGS